MQNKPQILRIIEWNRKRNGLALDLQLEAEMLREESHEFYTAETLVDRLDACADFEFVWHGTKAKFLSSPRYTLEDIVDCFSTFQNYHDLVWKDMVRILKEELTPSFPSRVQMDGTEDEFVTSLLSHVLDIVISANESKGTKKNAVGKIQKGPDYVPPEETIKAYLIDILGAEARRTLS